MGIVRKCITADGVFGVRASRLPEFWRAYPDARDFGWVPCDTCFDAQVERQRWINAGIPKKYASFTFDTFDCLTDRQRKGKERGREFAAYMAEGRAIDWQGEVKNSLLLIGMTGLGKSGLMAAIAESWIERGESVLWSDALELIAAIRHSYEDPDAMTADTIIARAQNAPLLCLDDLGDMESENKVSDHTREKFYEIVRHRHVNNLPTVYTTNLSRELMTAQFGHRITSRIYEMTHDIRLAGDDLRAKRPDLRIAANE